MRGVARVPSASGDRLPPATATALPSGGETETCPRCGSHNTKFCYYNNYNLAQPRYFCKACRRYWTVGGALRNVPIGGSTRRATQQQNKQQAPIAASSTRRRQAPSPAPVSTSPSSSSSSSPTLASLAVDTPSIAPRSAASKTEAIATDESAPMDAVRSFESLLSEPLPAGFLALGDPLLGGREGFGLGLGLGGGTAEVIDEIGFGRGRAAPVWPFFADEDGSVLVGGGSMAAGGVDGIEHERDTWQMVAGGVELVGGDGGDCFGWPELAISTTPGKGLL